MKIFSFDPYIGTLLVRKVQKALSLLIHPEIR